MFVSHVLDDDPNHYSMNDNINEEDGKDWTQECPKEYCMVKDKAAVERNEIQGHSLIGNGRTTGL